MKRAGFPALVSCFFILLTATPRPVRAASYLMTAFVPEVGRVTADVRLSAQEDDIKGMDLTRNVFGVRLSFVLYPALEGIGEAHILDYELEGHGQRGLGVTGGIKYQIPPLFPQVDTAVAVLAGFGSADRIDETDLTLLGLVSKDIAQGWTPYGGIGLCWNRQKFGGDERYGRVSETRLDPAVFGGIKYLFRNALGFSGDIFLQDGVGLEFSVSYRF